MDQFLEERKRTAAARGRETIMNPPLIIQSQLLATKFYAPMSPGMLIRRPRLHALLNESLKFALTLVSAPAGFGKTTLLSTWAQSLPATQAQVAWLSLDEDENDPQLFWTYVLSALDQQQPERFTPLFKSLQSPLALPLHSILTSLINLARESSEHLVLVLDDYHVITEQQVHNTLAYLVEHLPPHLHIILATRTDPPLPLSLLRTRRLLREIRTEQLRCSMQETKAFFQHVVSTPLPDQTIQEVVARTEGWLAGLQLLALSLPEHVDPLTLLQEVSGEQRYILDYLIEVVLQKQPVEVQMFLLRTSILERLSVSLCDAVMEQTGSQAMLEHLERANLFVVSLDSKRQWYRYHGLFAEALHYQLERRHADLMPVLHMRASQWYAQHQCTMQAIQHAFEAREWHWAADLIEQAYLPLLTFAWGVNRRALGQFNQWLEQLPAEILAGRPQFCVACGMMLWIVLPHFTLYAWLDIVEATRKAALDQTIVLADVSCTSCNPQARREQENLLGEILTMRAHIMSYRGDGQAVLACCERAEVLLLAENTLFHTFLAFTKFHLCYYSAINDGVTAIESGYQAIRCAQAAGYSILALTMMACTVSPLLAAGRLHEVERLTQQAVRQGTASDGSRLPEAGWSMSWQAEILREWNELDAARSLAVEAVAVCEQAISFSALYHVFEGYAVLVRVYLSCGELDAACSARQQCEQIGRLMNQEVCLCAHSHLAIVDQVRLWLACGELDCATRWIQELDWVKQPDNSFARERQAVACARVSLATVQPDLALQRLESALQRATAGQRWGHVMEIRLLQALAYQMLHEEPQALSALEEAVRLGEPERYIRSFVGEGKAMEALLYRLRKRNAKQGPTPYLDTLLAAFQQEKKKAHQPAEKSSKAHQPTEKSSKPQLLPEPLSERELQVLQLLAQGRSNQEIAQQLVIAYDTVKRHVSHIFSKLGVTNRVQVVKQARDLGLLDEQS
jgi:LuxR family maltose regulon positive regulatory protein